LIPEPPVAGTHEPDSCADSSVMNSTYLPALAALAGSAIGGLTSLASARLTQNRQDRAKQLSQDNARRQKLYKRFIDEASKLYADALAHDEAGFDRSYAPATE
jgi:hypothetical protein